MKWWNDMIAAIKAWFGKKNPKPVPTPVPVPVPTPTPTPEVIPVSEPSAVWPAFRCDKFLQHGTADENDVREAAMDDCKSLGLTCLRCNATDMNLEVAVHILHVKHPDGHFKLGDKNWYTKGLKHGITRYQFVVTPELAPKWISYTRDYPEGSVQFLAKDVAAVKQIITTRPVLAVPS